MGPGLCASLAVWRGGGGLPMLMVAGPECPGPVVGPVVGPVLVPVLVPWQERSG